MRIVIAVAMLLHGAAHLVGFAESWQLSMTERVPYKTTVLDGRLDLGTTGVRAAGLLWLLAAVAFGLVSAGAVMDTAWWASMAATTAIASLVLSLVWWPESRVGVAVNVLLIAALAMGRRAGWV